MADKLTMDKEQALSIAQQIRKISVDIDNAIKALEKAIGTEYEIRNETDTPIEELIEQYLDADMPVIFWACINMQEPIVGPSWNKTSGPASAVFPRPCRHSRSVPYRERLHSGEYFILT